MSSAPAELEVFARDLWPLTTARARRGEPVDAPSAVVRPATVEDVATFLAWCSERGVAVVPSGGRSGVCGGVLVDAGALHGRDAVVLDLRGLAGVEVLEVDQQARALAGTFGPDYERALERHGFTGGHYPQSLAISTVGGWLACRSAGQFSTRYGKGENLVAGLEVVLASGEILRLDAQPASAAGPDLARLFLGSEGTLGVIVAATLRVVRRGPRRGRAFGFPAFPDGLACIREVIQEGWRPAVVRLYDEADTAWNFPETSGSALVAVFEGPLAEAEEDGMARAAAAAGAEDLGEGLAEHWLEHRFDAVEQFEAVMRPDGPLGPNVIVDTMEVAAPWSRILGTYERLVDALQPHGLGVLCHASHVYPDGACLYFTFALQGADEADAEARYHAAWEQGMEACLAAGATITHHHGVGRLKAAWLRRELGEAGWRVLSSLKQALDPDRILNPGNLGL